MTVNVVLDISCFESCFIPFCSLVSYQEAEHNHEVEIVRPAITQEPQQWAKELNIDIPVPQPELVYHPSNVNPYSVPRGRTPAFDTDTPWDPTSVPDGRGSGYNINGPELYNTVYGGDYVDYDADS